MQYFSNQKLIPLFSTATDTNTHFYCYVGLLLNISLQQSPIIKYNNFNLKISCQIIHPSGEVISVKLSMIRMKRKSSSTSNSLPSISYINKEATRSMEKANVKRESLPSVALKKITIISSVSTSLKKEHC